MDRYVIEGEHSIPAIIRDARRAAGLTQARLADDLGTAQSAVSRWERGHDQPRLGTFVDIVRACGLRLEFLLEPEDVDRAQIRQQLAMTPTERLTAVVNVSRMLAGARPSG